VILRIIIAVILGLVVPAVVFNLIKDEPPARTTDPTTIERNTQRLVRGYVQSALRDPSSAEFRNQKGACGEVSSHNAFGGMSGFNRFIATSPELVFIDNGLTMTSLQFDEIWARVC
jgi:hypothetical protein